MSIITNCTHAKTALVALIVGTSAMLSACNDENTLGESLVQDKVSVNIYNTTASAGVSVENPSIQSRSIVQLLGKFSAPGYGKLESDIVTQFLPAVSLPDTLTAEKLDSVTLTLEMYSNQFTGDSIVPMGAQVHLLTRPLPSPIYSDFDPTGYYDPAVYASGIYAPSGIGLSTDSVMNLSIRTINIKLPRRFGVDIINKYNSDPDIFLNPQTFVDWFPGFYIANSFGSGRVIRVSRTSVRLYQGKTTFMVMAVTPEVINNSEMSLTISPDIAAMVAAGEQLLVAPVGYNVTFNFPANDLVQYYRAHTDRLAVVNSLTFSIPVDLVPNPYDIEPPTTLLMVLSKDLDTFFAGNKIPDNITAFTATYNSTAHTYDLGDIKGYLNMLLDKETVAAEDYAFTLTPINLTTENGSSGSSYVTGVAPYVGEPKMAKIRLQDSKITLTYSKQSINN